MNHPSSSTGGRDFLFVQSTTEIGGAETVLLNLFEASEELRRRSLIATLGFGQGDLPARLRSFGAEVVELKMSRLRYPWRLLGTLASLRARAREAGVQVVVGNGGHPQLVAGLTARLAGARSAFIVHAIYPRPLLRNDALDILALTGPCDRMLAVSRSVQEVLTELRPAVPSRLVYNGTPMREVSAEQALAARAELGAREGDVLIGVFGRLQRGKGQDVFLEAAGELARQRPRTRFAVVGGSVFGFEPEFFVGLKARATALGLDDRLVFTGFRPDGQRLMAACDIVCQPSRSTESFGMVIVEAMALGRAVVATAVGGPGEIIVSTDHGLLIPPGDVGALTHALCDLVDDPERRRAMGQAGRARVRDRFSIEVMAATLIGSLDEMLGPGRKA